MVGRKQNLNPLWKKLMKLVDLGELTPYIGDVLNVNANRTEVLLVNTKRCSNNDSASEQLKSSSVGRNPTRTRSLGFVTWKVMRRNAGDDIADWRIRKLSNSIRSLHHVLMTMNSKKEGWETVGEWSSLLQ